MLIKKYTVKNMNEALTRIRYELGKDAIIISQRKVRDKGVKGLFTPKLIEVTAALENAKSKDNNKENNRNNSENSFKESLDSIKKIMEKDKITKDIQKEVIKKDNEETLALKGEVKEMKELLSKILKNTEKEEDEFLTKVKELDINNDYIEELRKIYDTTSLNLKEAILEHIGDSLQIMDEELKGRVVLVGPTGVGKTTTIAKLAGKLSLLEHKSVGLITIDTYRIGAVEQLRTYAEIMNIPFKVVITIKEMEEAIKEMENLDVVLIDTTGRSSKNAMQISELRAFVKKAEPDHVLMVLSSITKNNDIKTILEGYKMLDYDKIIITKLDETSTYGSMYTIIKEAKKPIAYITVGQDVPGDIRIPNKDEVIKLILGEELIC